MVEDIPEVEASCWNFQLNAGRNIGCAKYVLLQNFKEHFGLYIFFKFTAKLWYFRDIPSGSLW